MTSYEKGKIYVFDGSSFAESEPSQEKKLPVTDDAHEKVKSVRGLLGKQLGIRPELSLVTSAMIICADENKILNAVKSLIVKIYLDEVDGATSASEEKGASGAPSKPTDNSNVAPPADIGRDDPRFGRRRRTWE